VVSNPWQFASGSLDANTGLYKFGARYYDSKVGRWTQLDSKGGGYIYTSNVPNMRVDPSGNFDAGPIFISTIVNGFVLPPTPVGVFVALTPGDIAGYTPAIISGISFALGLFAASLGNIGTPLAVIGASLGIGVQEAQGFSTFVCGGGGVRIDVYFLNPAFPLLNCA